MFSKINFPKITWFSLFFVLFSEKKIQNFFVLHSTEMGLLLAVLSIDTLFSMEKNANTSKQMWWKLILNKVCKD